MPQFDECKGGENCGYAYRHPPSVALIDRAIGVKSLVAADSAADMQVDDCCVVSRGPIVNRRCGPCCTKPLGKWLADVVASFLLLNCVPLIATILHTNIGFSDVL